MSSRIQVILSDDELANLDSLSKSLSLNRSQTIRKLISKTKISMPVFIANKDIIGLVNEFDMLLKSIIVEDRLEADETIKLNDIIKRIKEELNNSIKS